MTDGDAPNLLVAGRYRLVRLLRTSDVGAVWEATDERLDRPVALTMVEPSSGSTEDHGVVVGRAMREARLATRLEHPNGVRVFDVFQHNGEPCLVTELASVPTLAEKAGSLSEREVATVGGHVAAALAAAHAVGIVHRDVTPERILVTDDRTARIGGFGIAHPGTPAFVAPEVADGAEPGYASDVYSLGATLYASLEGAPPSLPVDPPHRAGALSPLLLRMLASDATVRPAMDEVSDQLGRLAAGETSAADAPAEPAGPRAAPGPRRRVLTVAAIAVVVALVVAGIVLWRQRDGGQPAVAPLPSSVTTTSPSVPPATTTPSTASPTPSVQGPPSANQLAAVVTRYYSLVPANLDPAFGLLTADYQTRVAGGRQAFQRFWDGYSAVAATEVTGSPPSTVTATVTYTTKAGQLTRERTTFGIVDDGGVLKIGASTVTSRS